MDKINIMLDPGHYTGYNTGIDSSYKEGNKMFTLATYLQKELNAMKVFNALITKKKVGDNPSLSTRGKMAITAKCEVFISLHSNAYSTSAPCGVVIYRSIKRPKSIKFATVLGNAISNVMKDLNGITYFRGITTRESGNTKGNDYYGVIRGAASSTTVPYILLIEHGFHTNKKECATLNKKANLKKIAKAEAVAIYEYFKSTGAIVEKKPVVKPPVVSNKPETFKVVTNLSKYNTAADAMSGKNIKGTYSPGTYYIFRTNTNGSINITTDKTAKVPGAWINPKKNVK